MKKSMFNLTLVGYIIGFILYPTMLLFGDVRYRLVRFLDYPSNMSSILIGLYALPLIIVFLPLLGSILVYKSRRLYYHYYMILVLQLLAFVILPLYLFVMFLLNGEYRI